MPPTPSKKTRLDERKIDVLSLADDLVELCDAIEQQNAESLSLDYKDDEPRSAAIRGLEQLRQGHFGGTLNERQDAQVVYVLRKLADQERMDKANDVIKQTERVTASEIRTLARKLRDVIRRK